MKHIELRRDFSWFWLASIVDAAKNSAAESGRPLLDVNTVTSTVTGKYTLVINQGGIQNRDMPRTAKELFKDEVLSYLIREKGIERPIKGKLDLHLAEGTIQRAIFHTV